MQKFTSFSALLVANIVLVVLLFSLDGLAPVAPDSYPTAILNFLVLLSVRFSIRPSISATLTVFLIFSSTLTVVLSLYLIIPFQVLFSLITGFLGIYLLKQNKKNSLLQFRNIRQQEAQPLFQKVIKVVVVIISALVVLNLVLLAAYKSERIIGNLVTVESGTLRIFCTQNGGSKGTILLEHGGGGTGIHFIHLQEQLAKRGWESCSYDRFGFGKSSRSGVDLKQRVDAISQALKDKNKPFVVAGHSAGGQMAQLFAHYYPDRTAGIVLIDSYPDYLMLEAIAANRSKEWYSGSRGSTISTLKLLRLFETFLFVDLFVGSMGNSSYSSVSASYYRTGYFWDSSYKDYSGQQSTQLLSTIANSQGQPLPYAELQFKLNWPRPKVKVLVLPSSQTVRNRSDIYWRQTLKYQQTMGAKVVLVDGDHSIPWTNPAAIAQQFSYFVAQ